MLDSQFSYLNLIQGMIKFFQSNFWKRKCAFNASLVLNTDFEASQFTFVKINMDVLGVSMWVTYYFCHS